MAWKLIPTFPYKMTKDMYTTKLQAGLGMIEETRILLNLWKPGMNSVELQKLALESGYFPNVTARRHHNIIAESFAPRYLIHDGQPALLLKKLLGTIPKTAFEQLLFLFTCRANLILADFVREVYWAAYSSGHNTLSNEEAKEFVTRANQDGKTTVPWSMSSINRISSYLTGACADFGLLEKGQKGLRKILPFHIESQVIVFLAYDLHSANKGDNQLLNDLDWALFGLDREDVFVALKRLALEDWFIVQAAGDVVRIGWRYKSMEELTDALIRE